MDFIKNLDLISPYIKSDSYASILDYLKADDLIIFEDITRLYDKAYLYEKSFLDNVTSRIEEGEIFHLLKRRLYPLRIL